MFIAAWSTYGFETAVCYTREIKNPKRIPSRPSSIRASCALRVHPCAALLPGRSRPEGMLAPDIDDGTGVGKAMAGMVGGGAIIETFVAILMIFALMLSIMTAMAGSSRTLYQGSVDGWLPRYLSTSTSTARRRGRCGRICVST